MRALLALLALLALSASLAGCGSDSSNGTGGGTSLTITYWAAGAGAADSETWTLACDPASGTLADPDTACERLADGGAELFDPVPPDTACTEIYGGPQVAQVDGTVDGEPVSASLNRTNGCEISRWEALSPWLLPPGGAS
jgi:Subtilisin inhibitor-like